MSESRLKLLKKLDELSSKLGDKDSKNFPLWINLISMIKSLQNSLIIKYIDNPTEEQKAEARTYDNRMEKFKNYLKKNPGLTEEERKKLLYGHN